MPGEYRLTVSAPAHQRVQRRVRVIEGARRTDLGAIALPAARALSGTIVAEKGRPVPGCAAISDGVALGFSDSRGRLVVDLPSPAPRFIVLTHAEFAPRIVPVIDGVDLALGTVQMSRGGTVACTINREKIDQDTTIAAELFQFIPGHGFQPRDSASVGQGQSFIQFRGAEPGEYAVRLKGNKPGEELIVPLTIIEGTLTEMPITIDPLRLHLRVLHGDQAMAHANVRLHNSASLDRRLWTPEIKLDDAGEANVDMWQRGPMWERT